MSENGYKIGAVGSSKADVSSEIEEKARDIGRYLGENEKVSILITGGCRGVPEYVEVGANEKGLPTVAYSIGEDWKEHKERFNQSPECNSIIPITNIYDEGFVRDKGKHERYKLRISPMVAQCDGIISVAGGLGTSMELIEALDLKEYVGLLEGTEGATDSIYSYFREIQSHTGLIMEEINNHVIAKEEPEELVESLIAKLEEE